MKAEKLDFEIRQVDEAYRLEQANDARLRAEA
jgi:hypothetical protein